MTFKVEVEGLPSLFMAGNSPGQVKNHLRKLVKQPSLIKSVERQTKHAVKKMYRAKAQGKEVDEMTQKDKKLPNLRVAVGKSAQLAKDTKARADKRKANKQGTSLAASTAIDEVSEKKLTGKDSKGHFRATEKGAGMTQKGVAAYNRKTGGNLKTAVTGKVKPGSKAAGRRKSYCARSAGQMKQFPKAANNPNSRLRQARRRWKC